MWQRHCTAFCMFAFDVTDAFTFFAFTFLLFSVLLFLWAHT